MGVTAIVRRLMSLSRAILAGAMLLSAFGPIVAADASVSGTTHRTPIYGVPGVVFTCGATQSYACTTGGYAGGDSWGYAPYGSVDGAGRRHNCTTYAAFKVAANGVGRPGWSGNANALVNELGLMIDLVKHNF